MAHKPKSALSPVLRTAIIASSVDMWKKMTWNLHSFQDLQRENPDEVDLEPLVYAAINLCISAQSLKEWVRGEVLRSKRAGGENYSDQDFMGEVKSGVPLQEMCDAIANTVKHSRLNENEWVGGTLRVSYIEADEYTPDAHLLEHSTDGQSWYISANALADLRHQWWSLLQHFGIVEGAPACAALGTAQHSRHVRKRPIYAAE